MVHMQLVDDDISCDKKINNNFFPDPAERMLHLLVLVETESLHHFFFFCFTQTHSSSISFSPFFLTFKVSII